MTEQEIAGLGPAFANYLGRYRSCFLQKRTAVHFDTYCRGLLSDLPRKSVEPIALEAGTAVRTLQEFLVTARWDHQQARGLLQQHLAEAVAALPADPLGPSASSTKPVAASGASETPGVQRQYLGCLGKIDNGIVTVHVGVAKGCFHALLDADLYLPKAWAADRPRCRAAGYPRRCALSAQVADRSGPVDPSERSGHHLRLAGVRRGLWGGGASVAGLEPGRSAFYGRSPGELRRRRPGRRADAAGRSAVALGQGQEGAALSAGPSGGGRLGVAGVGDAACGSRAGRIC